MKPKQVMRLLCACTEGESIDQRSTSLFNVGSVFKRFVDFVPQALQLAYVSEGGGMPAPIDR
jgi:hypothetical protein